MKAKTGLFLSSLLLILACQTEPTQEQSFPAIEVSEKLSLNEGEKWKANSETIEGIEAMLNTLNNDEIQSASELKKELMKSMGYIFKQCNMKGEAHEQLHHYILPLRNYVDELDEKELTKTELESKKQRIKEHLVLFSTYFK